MLLKLTDFAQVQHLVRNWYSQWHQISVPTREYRTRISNNIHNDL